jgi:hypothetical protein
MSTTQRDDRPLATELKFLIAASLGAEIRSWARQNMAPDPYASGPSGDTYQTTTLYFDTDAFDVFHRRGSFGRSKYRVRRYGTADVLFLERKMRTRDRLSKRRTLVPDTALQTLTAPTIDARWPGAWMHRRLLARQLHPRCVIRYQRMARVSMSAAGPLRLTVDDQLAAWAADGYSLAAPPAPVDLLTGQVILELKFRQEVPALFKRLVETFDLAPQKLSKYRTAAPALGLTTAAASDDAEASCSTC